MPWCSPRRLLAEAAHRVDGVDFVRPLVLAIAHYTREPQSHPARIARAALHAVESDLRDQLWAYIDRPAVARALQFQQPLCLPGQHRVGQPLEGLTEHDVPARLGVERPEMEVGEPALPPAMAPLGGEDQQVERDARLDLDPTSAASAGFVRRIERLDQHAFVTTRQRLAHELLTLSCIGSHDA